MRYAPLILFCFLFNLSSAQTSSNNYALFFAVHQYQDDGLTNLPNTIKNAEAIAEVLRTRYDFKTEIVRNPSMAQIEAKLSDYKRDYQLGRRDKGGQLLVFFSGHGVRQYNNGYFLPADADPDKVISTAMTYNNWRPFISEINCQHILVAVDACFSVTFDPDWRSMSGNTRFQRKGELSEEEKLLINHQKYRSRLFMTSDAKEDIVPGRSNFARKFLEGLSAFQGRFMSAQELFANSIKKAQPAPRGGDFEGDDPRSSFLFFPKYEIPKINTDQFNQRQRDMQAYRLITQNPSIEKCQQYLQDFPNGNFIGEVSQQLLQLQDEQEWEFAQLKNTKASYQNYLNLYPKGRYAAQARTKVQSNSPTISPSTFTDLDNMVFVQGGTFQMGSKDGESDETLHPVTLSDFYIAHHKVTVADFSKFVTSTSYKTTAEREGGSYIWENSDWKKKAGTNWRFDAVGTRRKQADYNHPVIHISWYDAVQYCNWMSSQQSLQKVYTINGTTVTANWNANGYRLPTEAEWEYAARSRGKDHKWAGTSKETELASFANYYEGGKKGNDGYKFTSPVGSFKANDLGLFDMSGNVWEWCWDWYDKAYYAKSPKSDPVGPNTGSNRVLRGGSWGNVPAYLRCALRGNFTPDLRLSFIGFRLSRAGR